MLAPTLLGRGRGSGEGRQAVQNAGRAKWKHLVVAPRVFPLEPSTLRLEQGISRSEEASLPLLPSLHCSATS